ncbi:MAG: hypothetical protein P1V20_30710 [Verrucomicrobiales bacterium]|nr:hypothetical protein [Verrucomicrobiales bacterium]
MIGFLLRQEFFIDEGPFCELLLRSAGVGGQGDPGSVPVFMKEGMDVSFSWAAARSVLLARRPIVGHSEG